MLAHAAAGSQDHDIHTSSQDASTKSASPRPACPRPSRLSYFPQAHRPSTIRSCKHSCNLLPCAEEEQLCYPDAAFDTMSEDGASSANSEESEVTLADVPRKRSSARASTAYALAHPAPLTLSRKLLHLRPKLLFQLQRVSATIRPTPVVDVLASTIIVPRLAKKFPRIFKSRMQLGPNDVMLFKSEDYQASNLDLSEVEGEAEALGRRDVIAVLCQNNDLPDCAEVCFGDGTIWHARALPKGVFEFTTEDSTSGRRVRARWIPKRRCRRQTETNPAKKAEATAEDGEKYNFTILNPSCRQHPILASLSRSMLDIPDYYAIPITKQQEHDSDGEDPPTPPRVVEQVDDDLRNVIQTTGIWVALRLGWCPNFQCVDRIRRSAPSTPTLPVANDKNKLSLSDMQDSVGAGKPTHRMSMSDAHRHSFSSARGKVIRSGSHIFGAGPKPAATCLKSESVATERTIETGTAFIKRATARRPAALSSHDSSDSILDPAIPIKCGSVIDLILSPPHTPEESSSSFQTAPSRHSTFLEFQADPTPPASPGKAQAMLHPAVAVTRSAGQDGIDADLASAINTQKEKGLERKGHWKTWCGIFCCED